jgi:hypothetical protein
MRLFLPEVSHDLRPFRRCLTLIATSAMTLPGSWHAIAWGVMWAACALTAAGWIVGPWVFLAGECGRGSR